MYVSNDDDKSSIKRCVMLEPRGSPFFKFFRATTCSSYLDNYVFVCHFVNTCSSVGWQCYKKDRYQSMDKMQRILFGQKNLFQIKIVNI